MTEDRITKALQPVQYSMSFAEMAERANELCELLNHPDRYKSKARGRSKGAFLAIIQGYQRELGANI